MQKKAAHHKGNPMIIILRIYITITPLGKEEAVLRARLIKENPE